MWFNRLFGGRKGETISASAARNELRGGWRGKVFCWIFNLFDKGHCAQALLDQAERDKKAGNI